MSSSSGPGFDLKQEEISYLTSNNLPAVLVNSHALRAPATGEITPGQDSYRGLPPAAAATATRG